MSHACGKQTCSANILRMIITQTHKMWMDLGPGKVHPGRGVLQAQRAETGAGQSLSAWPEVHMGMMRAMMGPWQPQGTHWCTKAPLHLASHPGITWLVLVSILGWKEPGPGYQENLREHGIYDSGRTETYALSTCWAFLRQVLFLDLSS